MAGYRYIPIFRITPLDGAVRTINLTTDLSYIHRPMRVDPVYRPEIDEREDVNGNLRPRLDGIRVEVEMRFAVGGTMTDHRLIAEIVSALLDSSKTVELSLDNGTVYREVILRTYRGPRPLGDKTYAGAEFSFAVRCVSLIDELPAIEQGSW